MASSFAVNEFITWKWLTAVNILHLFQANKEKQRGEEWAGKNQ